MHFKHPHLTTQEMENLQRELYRQDFSRLGPSLMRISRIWFSGYIIQKLPHGCCSFCRSTVAALLPAILFAPSKEARRRARALLRDIKRETGALTFTEMAKCLGAILLSGWTWFALKMNLFQQPKLLRLEYHPAKPEMREPACHLADLAPMSLRKAVLDE